MTTENPVVSHQVISRLKVVTWVVPDKNLKSEKPTMVKSENKKARERKNIPRHQRSILRKVLRDEYIRCCSIK